MTTAAGRSTTSRPDVQEIKNAYAHLFTSGTPIAKIKDAALRGMLFGDGDGSRTSGPEDDDEAESSKGAGVVGRSLAWKLFLIQTEPLAPNTSDVHPSPPLDALKHSREEYQRLLLEKMRAPDGSYEDGFVIPGTGRSPPRTKRSDKNLEMNNPLSLHDENPWTAWFASMDLRKEILQDVERTFPDIGYFRDPEVQAQLTNVLFLYSVTHTDIGYRQGMHELLAPLYYAIDFDSISPTNPDLPSPIEQFCSRDWVGADAWAVFSAVMRGVGRWYEWREPKRGAHTGAATPTSTMSFGRTPLSSHVQLDVAKSNNMESGSMQAYVAPIVETCNRIQGVLLKSVDPLLWKSLQDSGIEPQMYGIRWLRLLFTREFSMEDAMTLWDCLFACDPSFELVPWICVAMLLRIRNSLISSDYSTQLTYLLRYPSTPASLSSSVTQPPIHPCTLLLRQALTLQMSPTPITGVSVVQENSNLLSIPAEVPEAPPSPVMKRRGPRNQSYSSSSAEAGPSRGGAQSTMHFRQGSATPMGIPEFIARGLLERGESLGINKTVMNAVSEIKRNLPDLANTLTRLPTPLTPTSQTSSYAAYPLVDEKPPSERPPWEPKTRFEMERDITQLQSVQGRLGDSVAWIVDTLLLDETVEGVKERKREAVESLAYVRDVLKGIVPPGQVEEDRLLSEEDIKKRKEKAKKIAEEKVARPAHATDSIETSRRSQDVVSPPDRAHTTLSPPKPVATALPQFLSHSTAPQRQSQDYFTAGSSVSRSPPKIPSLAVPSAQNVKQKSASPTPSNASVLTPNKSAVPLAPWNHTPSTFARDTPIAGLPRMPSRPSAVATPRQHNTVRITSPYPGSTPASQTPTEGDQAPTAMPNRAQDPLGVLR